MENPPSTTSILRRATIARPLGDWQMLASRFAPKVILCGFPLWHDAYKPCSVPWYTQRCHLKDRDDGSVDIPNPGPQDFVAHNRGSAYLEPNDDDVSSGHMEDAPFYVHIATVEGQDTQVDIQYWFFYAYNGNVPTTVEPVGVFGSHEGDWEHVVVRVDVNTETVVQVTFAAHGSDEARTLTSHTTGRPDGDTFQLIGDTTTVFSAWHSHASYPDAGFHFRSKTYFLSNDVTGSGPVWQGTAEIIGITPDLLSASSSFTPPTWVAWKGRWGSTRESWHHPEGNSPTGPSGGGSWNPEPHPGTWTPLTAMNLGTSSATFSRIDMHLGPQGAMFVLALDSDGQTWVSWESRTGSTWSPWTRTGPKGLQSAHFVDDDQGALSIAGLGEDGSLYVATWSSVDAPAWTWTRLAVKAPGTTLFSAASLPGGQLVLASASASSLVIDRQTGADLAAPSSWQRFSLGGGGTGLDVVRMPDGQVQVMIGRNGFAALYRLGPAAAPSVSEVDAPPSDLLRATGERGALQQVVRPDGRMVWFYLNDNGQLYSTAAGGGMVGLPAPLRPLQSFVAMLDQHGALCVFASDGMQVMVVDEDVAKEGHWGGWDILGPPILDRTPPVEHFSASTLADGRKVVVAQFGGTMTAMQQKRT